MRSPCAPRPELRGAQLSRGVRDSARLVRRGYFRGFLTMARSVMAKSGLSKTWQTSNPTCS